MFLCLALFLRIYNLVSIFLCQIVVDVILCGRVVYYRVTIF
jgi:hypothetical protein